MKRLLLSILILSINFLSLQAQQSVQVDYSNSFVDYSDHTFHLSSRLSSTYNSECRESTSLLYYPDYPTLGNQRMSDYYPNGFLFHQIYQKPDTLTQTYVNSTRYTYYYNANHADSASTTESWINNSWQPANLSTHLRGTNPSSDTVLGQYWNSSLQAYVNQSRDITVYDNGGRMMSFLNEWWNADSTNWQPQYAYTYQYNASGFVTDFTFSDLNFFTDTYGLVEHEVYYRNTTNRLDSSYDVYYEFDDSARTSYTYYPTSLKLSQSISRYFHLDGSGRSNFSDTYYYDSTATSSFDSIVGQSFTIMPSDGVLSSTTTIRRTLDTNGNLLHSLQTITEQNGYIYTDENWLNEYGQPTHILNQSFNNNGLLVSGREDSAHYILCTPSALPVALLSFTGERRNSDVLLQWQTANEINLSRLELQRSVDGVHFTTLYTANTNGSSTSLKEYAYTDANAAMLNTSQLYYRLAEVNNDGSTEYSSIVKVTFNGVHLSVSIFPNPVQNTIYVQSSISLPATQIKIISMNGTVLYNSYRNVQAGVKYGIDVTRFAKGVYLIAIQSKDEKQNIRFIK